ncbi:MAG: methyltransferase domain-containing protein [Anaerolineales bacterium]|nr:methyltransferase domain-containing protein [Anaerolineales bacterium]
MARVTGLADKQFLAVQYRDASNLKSRMSIHRRFSTNPYGLLRWIFERFNLPPVCRILELGCGSGNLWMDNDGRIPDGWDVRLTDASVGMLGQARRNLGQSRRPYGFGAVDAQRIPFAGATFDAVIADHMLYHVPDRKKALMEIQRILKPGGRFYASTVGRGHMRELAELVAGFDPALDAWGAGHLDADTFMLENGAAQLTPLFTDVLLHRYEDALVVTEPAPLVEYILSGRITLDAEQRASLTKYVEEKMERAGGAFRIEKETGIFEAVRG